MDRTQNVDFLSLNEDFLKFDLDLGGSNQFLRFAHRLIMVITYAMLFKKLFNG
jgi:hypothetical protein